MNAAGYAIGALFVALLLVSGGAYLRIDQLQDAVTVERDRADDAIAGQALAEANLATLKCELARQNKAVDQLAAEARADDLAGSVAADVVMAAGRKAKQLDAAVGVQPAEVTEWFAKLFAR